MMKYQRTGCIILSEKGTTILNLQTGKRRFNPDHKLEHTIVGNTVWVNAPLSLSLDEWNKQKDHYVVCFFDWTDVYSKITTDWDQPSWTNPFDCPVCGTYFDMICSKCGFDLNRLT